MPSLVLIPAPCCTRQHTPCGSLAPNSTSPALPCLPLMHKNPTPYPLNSTKICFSFFFFIFPLHFEPLQYNVATVVPPRALWSPPEPLPLHPRRPRRLHNVLTLLPPPAPTPTIWGMETPRCLAARKPLPPPPPPTTPCTMQAPRASSSASKCPRASSLKPRKSPLPPPHRRTQVRCRCPPLHGAQAPPCHSAHPPTVPSRRATTHHVMAHNHPPRLPPRHGTQIHAASATSRRTS